MLTYQDFKKVADTGSAEAVAEFIEKMIGRHRGSKEMKIALEADEYDAQRNITINRYAKMLYTASGKAVPDFTAANNRIASNFFHMLNVRRCTYSLGNGVEFGKKETKKKLGLKFDTRLKEAANLALIHGRSYMFWNLDHVHVFKTTEFVPLLDEFDGRLRAGVRFWQLDNDKPLNVTLYEEDGYTGLRKVKGKTLEVVEEKAAYVRSTKKAPADAEETVTDARNYPALPIVMMWGSKLQQSTLVGMRASIDAFDMIRSGFANDLEECAQIYWILENYNGMNDADLIKFRDRMKLHHIATADTGDGGKVTAHTQEVPHEARVKFLAEIRAGIYEDFGILDLRTLSAAATNDHIEAGYQPQNDMADDFEFQVIEAVQQLLALQGIEDTPEFKRGKISNSKETVDMLATEASMVDIPDEVLLKLFPNFTPELVTEVLNAIAENGAQRVTRTPEDEPPDDEGEPQDGDA